MSDGKLIHETVYIEQNPAWKNFFEGKSGVQFIHRYLAYVVTGLMVYIWFKAKKTTINKLQQTLLKSLIWVVLIQFTLGVFTLLFLVPVILGVLHQVVAFFLLAIMT